MTLLIGRGEGSSFPYAGRPMHVQAGHGDSPAPGHLVTGDTPALAFMCDVGAALAADGPPDPDRMRGSLTRFSGHGWVW